MAKKTSKAAEKKQTKNKAAEETTPIVTGEENMEKKSAGMNSEEEGTSDKNSGSAENRKESDKDGNNLKKKDKSEKKSDAKDTNEEKIKELQDKYLRLTAEFDNYRKRTLKEKSDMLKSAGESVISKVLPVLDDLERALSSMAEAKDLEAVKSGVSLIYNKFRESLIQQGLKEIPAMGENFDTDIHEAVTKIPAPEEKLKGKIVDVIEKGYYLNEKVIRYPKVVIGE